jgi:hypothetical protein
MLSRWIYRETARLWLKGGHLYRKVKRLKTPRPHKRGKGGKHKG